jgi:hypothetical protein
VGITIANSTGTVAWLGGLIVRSGIVPLFRGSANEPLACNNLKAIRTDYPAGTLAVQPVLGARYENGVNNGPAQEAAEEVPSAFLCRVTPRMLRGVEQSSIP